MYSPQIKTRILALTSLALLALASIIYSGCAKGITGAQYQNSPPQVRFVNVPPDGSTFSANPIISWVGTDIDGRVVQFQYMVAIADIIPAAVPGQPTPAEAYAYADTVSPASWIVREVTLEDPANQDTVRMSADFDDPVNVIVRQLVFLRAIDDKGSSSDIVYRTFGRNDHYPQTGISPFVSPYVNVLQTRLGHGGIKAQWSGKDEIDFPGDDHPPVDFEWRLYGPFTQAESLAIIDSFTFPVLVTSERTYAVSDDTLTAERLIDTVFDFTKADTVIDSSMTPFDTQISVHIDRIFDIPVTLSNATLLEEAGARFDTVVDIGHVDTIFNSATKQRLVESSYNPLTNDSWVIDTSEVFLDVYRNDPLEVDGTDADTTRERSFLFWVRARDDAFVPDPTPTFSMFTVILPRHERDLLIVDNAKLSFTQNINGLYNPDCATHPVLGGFEDGIDTAKASYSQYLDNWRSGFVGSDNSSGFDTATFEPCGADTGAIPPNSIECDHTQYLPKNSSPDYMLGAGLPNGFTPWRPTLRDILKHKVVIMYKEHVQSALPVKQGTAGAIWIDEGALSGVNFWTMSRAVFQPTGFNKDTAMLYGVQNQGVPVVYSENFGVTGGFWQGWYGMNVTRQSPSNPLTPVRNEDFIGAVPVESFSPSEFPELVVDTGRLHSKLRWSDPDLCGRAWKDYRFMDSIGALPEVGFTIPNTNAGTESIYLYRSRFEEAKYPFFDLPFNDYQGTVVAVRRDAGFYRTSHWVFTPLVLEPTSFQVAFNTMMDWLFATWGGPSFGSAGRGRHLQSREELDYTSDAIRMAQRLEQERQRRRNEIMGGQTTIKNQFEFDKRYRQWQAEKRALELVESATF